MLRRLTCHQTSSLNLCRNLAKWQTTINLRFLNPQLYQKIATYSDKGRNSQVRAIDDRNNNNGISKVVTAFKGNPYVRLMRMDKPIGESTLEPD